MIKRISTITIMAAFILSSVVVLAGTPTVDDILQKSIAARGGDKLKAVKSYSSEMSMEIMGMSGTIKYYVQLPDKIRFEQNMMGQEQVTIINGDKGWMIQGGATQDLTPEMLAQMKKGLESQTGLYGKAYMNYKENGITYELEGIEDVNGTSTYKIKQTTKEGTVARIYFSTKDYLEVKISTTTEMQGQSIDMDILIKENKLIDGVLVPIKMDMAMQGMNVVMNITDYKINPKFDDKLFNP